MVARIQIRRDTAGDWTAANPTLSAGEMGWESDTSKAKIGDGSTAWNSLGYFIYNPTFAQVTSKPTTIAGYGITDAFDGVFGSLTGTPTTLAGYGITDALTSVAFSDLTSTPTTIVGYGITDAFSGNFNDLGGKPTTIAGYGITDAFNGAFSSLIGKPTTIAGYGITDAFDGAFGSLSGKPTTLAGYGITDAFSKSFGDLLNKPTTIAGYGITDAFSGDFPSLSNKPTTLSGYGITDGATIASPTFTGTPAAPTATSGTNSTQIATTAFVQSAITPFAEIDAATKLFFSDTEPAITALGHAWIELDTGAVYKVEENSSTIPLHSGLVSSSSASVTIPSATDVVTDLTLSAGLPSGTITFSIPVFLESFSSSGVNDPIIGSVTYADNTTANISSNSFTRSTGNAFDTKVKSFTYGSDGTTNSSTSTMTITISAEPIWVQKASAIQAKIDAVIDSAPAALNTLNELAAALGDDANFSTTITNSLATKAPLQSPGLTGTPTAPTAATGTNTTQIATTAFVTTAVGTPLQLTDFSLTSNTASGGGALTYNNSTGAFTYTPPDLSSFITGVSFAAVTNKPTTVSGYGITDALTTGADANIGSNNFITTGKSYYSNVFSQVSDLPSASTYHGMFAHVHATGAGYFAHGGNWIRLANQSELFSGAFSALTGTPTTLSGYGITDAAPLASPALTGTPTAPTASSGTNTTQIATTAYVQSAISGFSAGANVSVGTSAPSSPSAGDLWFDSEYLVLYVYYADGTSNQWVQTNPSSIDPSGFDGTFSALSGKPTTLSGYGITDAAPLASPTFTGTPVAPTASSGTNTTQLATTAFVQQEVTSAGSYNDASVDTHLNRSTANANEVLSFNGTDYAWVAQTTQEFIKAYRFDGTLSTNTGTKRLYLQKAYTLKSIHAYVDTASAGSSINITVKKNGTSLQTLSIGAGQTAVSVTSLTHSVAANDYLTIDITQVGSSTAGENLYLVFTFN
tara:strand:+ start:297 stop:3224 length:2928 start_codon:yes stop_codon:yes gene_type:complete